MAEILYLWEQGYKIVKGRKRIISQKEYQERNADMKTYAQYVAESKPITNNLAPPGAMPKYTKGFSHKHRFKLQAMKRKGEIFVHQVPVLKSGIISPSKLKKMKG